MHMRVCFCNDVWQCPHQFLYQRQADVLLLQRHFCAFLLPFSFSLLLMDCFYFPCVSKAIIHSKCLNYSDGKWPRMEREGKEEDGERRWREERGEESRQSGGDLKRKKRWIEETGELIYLHSSRVWKYREKKNPRLGQLRPLICNSSTVMHYLAKTFLPLSDRHSERG